MCLGESAGSDMAAAAVCAGQGLVHWPPDCSLATKKGEWGLGCFLTPVAVVSLHKLARAQGALPSGGNLLPVQ